MNDIFEAFDEYINEAGRNPLIKSAPEEGEIVNAIENRRYVGIYYTEENEKKVKSGFRLIEPHVFGKGFQRDSKIYNTGTKYLRAYVVMDSSKDEQANKKFPEEKGAKRKSVSKSKHRPYWRLFKVENISNWTDLKKTFSKLRPNYNPADKLLVEIIKSVPINELKESTFLHFDEYKKNINEMKNIPTFDEFINEDYTQIINEGLDADIIKKVVNDIRRNDEDMNVTRDFVESKIKKMKLNPKDLRYTLDKILVQFGINPMDESINLQKIANTIIDDEWLDPEDKDKYTQEFVNDVIDLYNREEVKNKKDQEYIDNNKGTIYNFIRKRVQIKESANNKLFRVTKSKIESYIRSNKNHTVYSAAEHFGLDANQIKSILNGTIKYIDTDSDLDEMIKNDIEVEKTKDSIYLQKSGKEVMFSSDKETIKLVAKALSDKISKSNDWTAIESSEGDIFIERKRGNDYITIKQVEDKDEYSVEIQVPVKSISKIIDQIQESMNEQ